MSDGHRPARSLAEAVRGFIEPRPRTVERLTAGGGTVVEEDEAPPLLDGLLAAAGSTTSSDGGPAKGKGGTPANLEALDLLDRVRITVAEWLELTGLGPDVSGRPDDAPAPRRLRREHDVARSLRRLVVHAWTQDDQREAQLTRIVTRWARDVLALLEGERAVRAVRGIACPACHGDTVWETDDSREDVRAWPLRVDLVDRRVKGVGCRLCDRYWFRGEGVVELAGLLDMPPQVVEDALLAYDTPTLAYTTNPEGHAA